MGFTRLNFVFPSPSVRTKYYFGRRPGGGRWGCNNQTTPLRNLYPKPFTVWQEDIKTWDKLKPFETDSNWEITFRVQHTHRLSERREEYKWCHRRWNTLYEHICIYIWRLIRFCCDSVRLDVNKTITFYSQHWKFVFKWVYRQLVVAAWLSYVHTKYVFLFVHPVDNQ